MTSDSTPQAEGEPAPESFRLLRDERFLRYLWAKFLSLAGQNALIYGLFIAVITRQESSLATSAFVLASVVPSILLSVPGGLFADHTPNKFGLLSTLAVRIALVYLFFDVGPDIGPVIGLTFLVWTAYQFFSPAESAAVLALVPQERMAHASSLLQALSLGAQLTGAGVIAPLAVRLLDTDGLYIIVLLMLVTSFVLFAMISNLSAEQEREARRLSPWRALPVGLRTIRADDALASITLTRTLLDTGMLAFIVIAPVFIVDELGTSASNAIYIALPGAIGLAVGLVVSPALLAVMSARALALWGFVMFTAIMLVLPAVDTYAPEVAGRLGPFRDLQEFFNVSDAIVATMLLLPIGGLGASLVQVAARTEVYRRAPAPVIAQVFSTQSAIGSTMGLLPTFAVGFMLDHLPVAVVLEAVALTLVVLAVLAWVRGVHAGAPAQAVEEPADWRAHQH